jgi:hypothetical protein
VADIFTEVDEELRADRARAFWQKYGNYLIGAALLAVLAAALWWGWQRYDNYRRQQASVEFLQAVQQQQKDAQAGNAALDRVAAQGGGYGLLARFQLANNAAASDPAHAADLLAAIAGDEKVDPAARHLAAIEAGLMKLQVNKPADALALVQPLAVEGNPYRLSALEVSGLAQLAAGDKDKARETFTQLQGLASAPDAAAPAMALRAQQMLDRLQK